MDIYTFGKIVKVKRLLQRTMYLFFVQRAIAILKIKIRIPLKLIILFG